MATFESVFPPGGSTSVVTIVTGNSSAVQTKATKFLFQVVSDQAVHIGFGMGSGFTAAAATDFLVPANTVVKFDLGQYDRFAFYNGSGSTANVYYLPLSRA